MVEIKTLVLERIFLLSQTPFSHFPNYVTYKADIVLFSRLESLFLKRYFVSSFFFNFGSILREVYTIVKKKMYSDDNKDNRQWEVFLSQKAIFFIKHNSLDCLSLSPVKYFVF